MRWVGANIASHGGDPARVVPDGAFGRRSARRNLCRAIPSSTDPGASAWSARSCVSGLYDFSKFEPGPPEKAYFGEDEAKRAEGSTLALLPETKVRLMVVYAELDPPNFVEQAKLLGDDAVQGQPLLAACCASPSTATCPRSTPSTRRTSR